MEAYSGCHEPFLRYCSALSYNKMDTEDLVQDVLLSAFHRFDKIKKKEELLHYLVRAARNRSISIWRKSRRKTELLEAHQERLLANGATPDVLTEIQLLYAALEKLPINQRDALILYEISGFSMKEIADIQNSNANAVKTLVSRGRTKLREILQTDSSGQVAETMRAFRTYCL